MSMRFTLIGDERAISFSGPGHILKMLTAVVSSSCTRLPDVLSELEALDDEFVAMLRRELLVFDEHCVAGNEELTLSWFRNQPGAESHAFRVIDPLSRRKSTEAERLGLTIFNLNERRIVQVQNSYGNLLRQDRGRLRRGGKPTGSYYAYQLPSNWAIVP